MTATVLEQQSPLASVQLVWVAGYGAESRVPMQGAHQPGWGLGGLLGLLGRRWAGSKHASTAPSCPLSSPVAARPPACPPTRCAAGADGTTYSATIPAAAATPGALVRWYVQAADVAGEATRDPPFRDPEERQYW